MGEQVNNLIVLLVVIPMAAGIATVALRGFVPPAMSVHSANSSARTKMEAGIATIERMVRERGA